MSKSKKAHLTTEKTITKLEENPENIWGTDKWRKFYRDLSLASLAAGIMIRIFLPNAPYAVAENAIIWLFTAISLLFVCWDWLYEKRNSSVWLWIGISSIALIPWLTTLYAIDSNMSQNQAFVWLSDVFVFVTICYWGRIASLRNMIINFTLSCFALELLYCVYQRWIGLPLSRFFVHQNPDIIQELNISSSLVHWFYIRLSSSHIFGHFPLTNSLAGYLLLFCPLLYVLAWKSTAKNTKIWATLWGCIGTLVFILTYSRGALLAGIVGIFLYISYYGICKYPKKMLVFSLIFLCIAASILFVSTQTNILAMTGGQITSFSMRLGYWESCYSIWKNHFFSGIGVANFPHYYYTYKPIWVEETNTAHNCLFQWIVETGIFGIVTLVLLGILIWKYANVPFLEQEVSSPNEHSMAKADESNTVLLRNDSNIHSLSNSYFYTLACTGLFCLIFLATLRQSFEWDSVEYWLEKNYHFSAYAISILSYVLVCSILCIFFLLFWGFSRWNRHTPSKILYAGSTIGLLGYSLHCLLDMNTYIPTLSQSSWILFSFWISSKLPLDMYNIRPWVRRVVLVCGIFFVMYLSFYEVPKQIEIGHWKTLFARSGYTEVDGYEDKLEHAIRVAPHDPELCNHYSFIQIQALQKYVQSNPSVLVTSIQEVLAEIRKPLETLQTYNPKNIQSIWYLSRFYREEAQIYARIRAYTLQKQCIALAENYIQKAIQLYPYKTKFLWFAANLYRENKDYNTARQYYLMAIYAANWEILFLGPEREKLEKDFLSMPK